MKIDVVIVTYNRIDKLKKALKAFEKQSAMPGKIVIVNNNSTDGTADYLEKWKEKADKFQKVVLNLSENVGGSGGFYAGINYLVNNNSDWIWVSDDDAYPHQDALQQAYDFLKNNDTTSVSAICGQVIANNVTDYGHRKFVKKGKHRIFEINSKEEDYQKYSFEIDLFTYVGTIMNVNALKKCGITNKDLFIYYDDTDHARRLKKFGKIICFPGIKINHDVTLPEKSGEYTWKTYYLFRNRLYFLKNNFGKKYSDFEKILIYLRIIKKHNKKCTKLILSAVKDFESNKLGIHELYKPGWSLKK